MRTPWRSPCRRRPPPTRACIIVMSNQGWRLRWPSTERETGPAQKFGKMGKETENGPRPEMAEKWPPKWKTGPQNGFSISAAMFWPFSGLGLFSIFFLILPGFLCRAGFSILDKRGDQIDAWTISHAMMLPGIAAHYADSIFSALEEGLITSGVFSLKGSLEFLRSLNSRESLDYGQILTCFPHSLESIESLNSLES